jgi:hypothetical protein
VVLPQWRCRSAPELAKLTTPLPSPRTSEAHRPDPFLLAPPKHRRRRAPPPPPLLRRGEPITGRPEPHKDHLEVLHSPLLICPQLSPCHRSRTSPGNAAPSPALLHSPARDLQLKETESSGV